MSVGSIFLGLALLVVATTFILRPLFLPANPSASSFSSANRGSSLASLLAQKEALLGQIQTLELDFDAGKISQVRFETERRQLVEQAAGILRQIDHLPPDKEAAIEAAIAQFRAHPSAPMSDEHPPANFCPQCGEGVQSADKFCAHCGVSLGAVA